jgi:hypothetical protein
MASKAEPRLTFNPEEGSGDFQSSKIKAALMGRISSRCVYWSSCRASENEDESGHHQIAREIAQRMKKTGSGGNLKVDSPFGALGTM